MKYFLVEGIIKDKSKMNNDLLNQHKKYTSKAMSNGLYFMSSLKSDMSGGLFIIKMNSIEELKNYLYNEPFYKAGMQDYIIKEFNCHYINDNQNWFKDK